MTQVKVIVRGSPYRAVAIDAVGEVVSVKYPGTRIEQWKVRFSNGVTWTFYPDELQTINVEREPVSAGAHR